MLKLILIHLITKYSRVKIYFLIPNFQLVNFYSNKVNNA